MNTNTVTSGRFWRTTLHILIGLLAISFFGYLSGANAQASYKLVITGSLLGVKNGTQIKFYDIEREFQHNPRYDFTLPAGADELIITGSLLGVKNGTQIKFYDIEKEFQHNPKYDFVIAGYNNGNEKEERNEEPKSYGNKKTNSIGMNFVYIEPGTFMMGSPPDEPGREWDETQHQVTLTQGYYMQTTPVTQGQWKAVMESNPSYFSDCGANCPVERVSWHDAQDFIAALNQHEGTTHYTLPTEAQWEYAARAGSTTAFANGQITETGDGYDPVLDSMGWYVYNSKVTYSGCFDLSEHGGPSCAGTHLVAQKDPNVWGLYDMHGNVTEWVADWKGSYPTTAVVDPTGTASGTYRVVRGGVWTHGAKYSRSAYRTQAPPEGLNFGVIGFRLALLPGH